MSILPGLVAAYNALPTIFKVLFHDKKGPTNRKKIMPREKVYGKRKANAPRAVIDEKSPQKPGRQTKRLSSSESPPRSLALTSSTDDEERKKKPMKPRSRIRPVENSNPENPHKPSRVESKRSTKTKKGAENGSDSHGSRSKNLCIEQGQSERKGLIERELHDVEKRGARFRIDGGNAGSNKVESGLRREAYQDVELRGGKNADPQPENGCEKHSLYSKDSRRPNSRPGPVVPESSVRPQLRHERQISEEGSGWQTDASAIAVIQPFRSKPRKEKVLSAKPRQRQSSGFVHDEKFTAYAQPVLNEILSPMPSRGIRKFSSWASRTGNMLNVVKIAEGSYGEVYKLCLRPEMCHQNAGISASKLERLRAYGEGIFKVVALRAQSGAGSKKFTSIDEIVSEVRMLKYFDPVPGFARFREVHVVQGRFPKTFQDAWNHFKRTHPADDCLNPNPASRKIYPDSQLWAILEMDDAGCELEKFSWRSIIQIYDIFWGVAMALARAEEYALFEVCHDVICRVETLANMIYSTGIFIWEISASERLAQMAVWIRSMISWMSRPESIQADSALVLWKQPLSTTRFHEPISWGKIKPLRLPFLTWTKRIYSVRLAAMRMRCF